MSVVSDIEIRLRADIARLQQDMTQARQAVGGAMNHITRSIDQAKAGLKMLGGYFAIDAVLSYSKSIIDAADALTDLSARTKISVEDLAGLQYGAKMSGTELEEAAGAISKLTMNMGKESEKFRALGITAKEPLEAFKQLADIFKNIQDPQMRAAFGAEALGKTWQSSAILLDEGSDGIAKLMAKGQALSGITTEVSGQAAEFNDKLDEMGAMASGASTRIMADLLPLLSSLQDDLLGTADGAESVGNSFSVVKETFRALYLLGGNVAFVFKAVGTEIGGIAAQIAALGSGDIQGFLRIGETMKADAVSAREAFDKWEQKVLTVGNAAATASKQVDELTEAEKKASEEARIAAEKKAAEFLAAQENEKARAKAAAEAAAAQKKAQAEYAASVKAAKTFIEGLKIENAQLGMNAAQVKEMAAQREAAKAPTAALRAEIVREAESLARNSEMWAMRQKAEESASAVSTEYYAKLTKGVTDIDDQIDSMKRQIEVYGLTEKAVVDLSLAQAEAALAAGPASYAELIALDARIAKLKELQELVGKKAGLEATKATAEAQSEVWKSIERTAHDTFVSIADGGKDTAQRLKDTLKNVVFDWLYQQTLKKWIIQLQPTTAGGGGMMDAASSMFGQSGGGMTGAVQAGKMLLKTFSSGFSASLGTTIGQLGKTFGSNAVMSFGAGMQGHSAATVASAGGSASAASAGSSMASSLPIVGAIVAGMMANNKFFDDGWKLDASDIIKSQMSSFFKGNGFAPIVGVMTASMNVFEKAMKGLGVNAKFASMLSGSSVFARAFGRKAATIEGQGIEGSIGTGGFTGQAFAEMLQKGGWFRSDKRTTERTALDSGQEKAFDDTIKGVVDSVRSMGAALGLEASAIDGYSKQVKITLTKDEAENQKLIEAAFGGLADDLSALMLPAVAQFAQAGETASTTLQRVVTGFQVVEEVLNGLSLTSQQVFGSVGVASLAARERLLGLVGGIEGLATKATFFADNFLTAEQRMAPVQARVVEQLNKLGYAGVSTTEEFASAVTALAQSGQLATQAGAETYAAMLELAPAFKQVADYNKALSDQTIQKAKESADAAAALAEKRTGLQIEIMEMEGNAAGALAARRQLEIDAMDDSLDYLLLRKHALEDEASAAAAAAAAAQTRANTNASAAQDMSTLLGTTFARLQTAVAAEKADIERAQTDSLAGLQRQIDNVNGSIETTRNLSDSLRNAIKGLRVEGAEGASRASAQAQIARALSVAKASGILPSADELADAISAAQASADDFGSYAEYVKATARTANDLEQLGGVATRQLSIEQRNLEALVSQREQIRASGDAQVAKLDGVISMAQAQIDAINGVDNSVLSVVQALAGFKGALAGASAPPVIGADGSMSGLTVAQLYRQVLGREGEAAGIAYWENLFGQVVDATEISQFLQGSAAELAAKARGENAWLYTAQQNSRMGGESNTEIAARLDALINSMDKVATHTGQFAGQFDNVTAGGNGMLTVPA